MKHEINSQNTKMMLAETLISLLEKEPISKITVSELVNLCEINRKTFYYHFQDVYDLLEWYLNEEMLKAMQNIDILDDFNTTITYSIEYMERHSYLRNCIDNPLGRDKIVQLLNRALYPKALEMLDELQHRYEKTIETDFKEFIAKSVTRMTILSIIDAIENTDDFDVERMKLYLSDVLHASMDGFFQRL